MSLAPPKAIFFDAAGTLFTVNGSVGEIYARLAREHDKEVSVSDLEAGFRRCFANAPPMAWSNVRIQFPPSRADVRGRAPSASLFRIAHFIVVRAPCATPL